MSYIEEIQNRRNLVKTNIAKSFGVEFQKSEDNEFEKAVYADTAENRKLGRVGQVYHRGRKKTEIDEPGIVRKKKIIDDKKSKISSQIPKHFSYTTNSKLIDWTDYNKTSTPTENNMKLGKEAYKLFPKGMQFKDSKGNIWTVDKHDKEYESTRYEGIGCIRLRNEKKKVYRITPYGLLTGLRNTGTTGIAELDKYLREKAPFQISPSEKKRQLKIFNELDKEWQDKLKGNFEVFGVRK